MREIVSLQNSNEVDSDSETEDLGKKTFLRHRKESGTSLAVSDTENSKRTKPYKLLIVPSRGISHRFRHLLVDLTNFLPHAKKESKQSKANLSELQELAELSNCDSILYFEQRKHNDCYMWISQPSLSVKFMVNNVHTTTELSMTGNCLKGSRPILSFDSAFDEQPHYSLLKELLRVTFGVPKNSKRSKPFIDRTMTFSILDGKIWVRNYEIQEDNLIEIGPRFVLQVIKIFGGSFGGELLFENENYISANNVRRMLKGKSVIKHKKRQASKMEKMIKMEMHKLAKDPLDSVFE
jgi:ribosome biogenesis protein BRX1